MQLDQEAFVNSAVAAGSWVLHNNPSGKAAQLYVGQQQSGSSVLEELMGYAQELKVPIEQKIVDCEWQTASVPERAFSFAFKLMV